MLWTKNVQQLSKYYFEFVDVVMNENKKYSIGVMNELVT